MFVTLIYFTTGKQTVWQTATPLRDRNLLLVYKLQ